MRPECPPIAVLRVDASIEIAARTNSWRALLLYTVLRARTNNFQQGWELSVNQLVEDLCGLASRRTVQEWLGWLEEEGFIKRKRLGRTADGRVVPAGPGAREIKSRIYAPESSIPLPDRECLTLRTSRRLEDCAAGDVGDVCTVVTQRAVSERPQSALRALIER